MAGLIITAKALQNKMDKYKKDILARQAAFESMGHDSGMDLNKMLEQEMDKMVADFRLQCKLAVKLRDVAIEEGLIQPPKTQGTPMLEDSPLLSGLYALITIRPAPGSCLVFFETRVAQWMERPYIIGAEYVFEQVGEDEETMGEGFHAHAVVHLKKSTRAGAIAKDITGDMEPMACLVQIGEDPAKHSKPKKFLKTQRDLEWSLNYIRGDKHNPEKADAVAVNEMWRKLNGLQERYYIREWDNRESRPDAVIIEEIVD